MRLPRGSRIYGIHVVLPLDRAVCLCHLLITERDGLPRGVRIRIDRPTHLAGAVYGDGRSQHAHVQREGRGRLRDVYVINKDGTGSHNTKSGVRIDPVVADVLRGRGFDIAGTNEVRFLSGWHRRWLLPILVRLGVDGRSIVVCAEPFDGDPLANDSLELRLGDADDLSVVGDQHREH